MVNCLKEMVWRHVSKGRKNEYNYHYRTYFYDAPPLALNRVHLPLIEDGEKTPRVRNFTKSSDYIFRKELIDELKKQKNLLYDLAL